MALTDHKITDADITSNGMQQYGRYPELTTPNMQKAFDALTEDVVKPKLNAIVDDLADTAATKGADLVGFDAGTSGLESANAGAAIREVKEDLEQAVIAAGNVPTGGTTGQVLTKHTDNDRDVEWTAPLAKHMYTATISAAWAGTEAPYTQDVTIAGILSTDAPHITPVYSATLETAIAQKEAWAMVSEADAGDGKITFTCFEDKPTVAIPIFVEVLR